MRHWYLAICLLALMLAVPCAGHAQSRVALVVGNSAYQNAPTLPNLVNDANDISGALRRLNFEVTTLSDARYDDIRRALIGFGQKARGAEIAVVFFSGHGVEIGGENFLLPIDAQLANDVDVPE